MTVAAMAVSGCATVNMTEVASPVATKAEAPAQKNIVLRTASKLYAAFQSKGFVAKTSRKKLQSAASILLNGLEQRELTSDVSYEARNLPRSVVIEDITYAAQEIRRTANAAEIYFELSESNQKLRNELNELEQALLASREAFNTFEKTVAANSVELQSLNIEVQRLKRITDNFGDRVRDQAATEMAELRKGNT